MINPKVVALVVLSLFLAGWSGTHAAIAQTGTVPTVCTWGGTPAAPTGTFAATPGLTNTPSSGALIFSATGVLAGGSGCTGRLTFRGSVGTGSSCSSMTFAAKTTGLPGVSRAVGRGAGPFAYELLYNSA